MAIVNAEVRFAPKLTAWFTANPTKVLQDGEIVYCSDGANIGKYVIGDNSTQLSSLVFYGGISSSGLTIGTTTITSGTNTRILYNNSGVVGEYTLTGSGTVVAMATSPTFVTDITTPLIIGGTGVGSRITYKGTTGNGTLSSPAHTFVSGNNGSITGLEILHSGLVNVTTLYASSNIDVPVIYGGLSSGGTLTLSSTEHATKGNIYLGSSTGLNFDQVNTRLGLGINPSARFHLRSTFGANGGLLLDLAANSASADTSYTSFDFKVPTTGLLGQFFATASNYSATGVNLAANSLGLLSYSTNGQLALGAGGSGGYTTITCGGYASTNEGFRVDANLNVSIGNAAIATNATNGFLYVTACAGTPTGVPTAKTGRIPIVADSTNNKLYIYSGGAWVALN